MNICIIISLFFSVVNSARILGWFNFPSISHQTVFQPIWRELSMKGYEVTVITPNPLSEPKLKNLTEIKTNFTYDIFKGIDISNCRPEIMSSFEIQYIFQKAHERTIDMTIRSGIVSEVLNKPENYYDLIIIEAHSPILYGLHYKFKTPLIAISSLDSFSYLQYLFGNSINPALYTDTITGYSGHLNLWGKLNNIYSTFGLFLLNRYIIYPNNDLIARNYFGSSMPYIEDVIKNTSLLFLNVNPLFSDRKPLTPNVMKFSYIKRMMKDALPMDLQRILDKAENGAIYFSLGTNVRFDHIEQNLKTTIMNALGELPYTVLCKWESEDYAGKPKNVVLRKWFPQQSILAHKNVRLFVSQGGLQSSEEAISNGVPMVVVPFLGDQPMNAKILTSYGIAETIPLKVLTVEILRDTILRVANDEKYRMKAQELRSIFLDQPQSGLEKIVWWCEYVIRHKGATHLRSPGADINLYEYFMLDIFAVILTAAFVIYKLSRIILKFTANFLSSIFTRTKSKKN